MGRGRALPRAPKRSRAAEPRHAGRLRLGSGQLRRVSAHSCDGPCRGPRWHRASRLERQRGAARHGAS